MSINIGPPAIEELRPRITVIGVGGAGGNAIANMINAEIEGVDFIVANTDAQALNHSIAEHRIQLGPEITAGLGAGSRPEVGRAAAEETLAEIERAIDGVHMCFIAAGMGGGTGTGAAPVIAKAARDKGILTVGVVTKPFLFEGSRRQRSAESGIEELQKHVDTLIVIPNQNLFLVAKAETTFKEAFELADEVLQQGVRSITDLMVMPGLINLDFADVRSVMGEMGKAMMGTGEGEGENRALEAAEKAIANPLLDGVSMQGAKGVIISIIGGEDMKLLEVDEAANHIRDLVDPNANIIWGSAFNPDLQGKIRVSVVATGIEQTAEQAVEASRPVSMTASRGPVRPSSVTPAAGSPPLFERASTQAQPEPAPVAAEVEDDAALSLEGFDQVAEDDTKQEAEVASLDNQGDADGVRGAGYASLSALRASGREPLELEEPAAPQAANGAAGQDDLLSNASRLADEDGQVSPLVARKRPAISGEEGDGQARSGFGGGATLFERMANLSRGTRPSNEDRGDDDDDGGSSISIPRFLNRQNNQ